MQKVFIIAEAGINHNGCIDLAKQMIDVAVDARVDAIKFQSFKAEKLVSRNAPKAEYQLINTGHDESQFSMIKKLELSLDAHLELLDYCKQKDIEFLSSPFDEESADMLIHMGVSKIKIPSGEINNLPYLKHIGKFNKEVILSTGMSTMEEVENAILVLTEAGTDKNLIIVLHCNSEYPTSYKDVNLLAMLTIRDKCHVKVGYSDHTLGIEVPIAAVALGAKVIEKHFTLDRNLPGPDHKSSLEPDELKQMVHFIRNIEESLGTGTKIPSESEKKNIKVARKSIHYSKSFFSGHILGKDDIIMKRPGSGLSSEYVDKIIGKTLKKGVIQDDLLRMEDLE